MRRKDAKRGFFCLCSSLLSVFVTATFFLLSASSFSSDDNDDDEGDDDEEDDDVTIVTAWGHTLSLSLAR